MPETNLLFITTDQQRWDSLPCYGLEFMQTPHLDRLGQEGIVFERCYTPAPLCVPARASILSGQWPSTTGVLGNNHGLAAETPVWPQLLSQAGYRTAAIGKMHFSPWDARMGFQERISAEDKRHTYLPDDFVKFLRSHGLERVHPTANPGYFESLGAPVTPLAKRFHVDAFVADQAAEWLRRHADEPFAIWVSFPGPHDPYDPPEELAGMYEDAPIPAPTGSRSELASKPRAQTHAGAESLDNPMFQIDPTQASPAQYRRWRAHYYANISLIDEGIGKILAALSATGVLEKTLIIFTSDHGDALGDHGLAYKAFFYDAMVRVPLIIRGPGIASGHRSPALVSLLDLVPMMYRACGVAPPPTLQGIDISPLMSNPMGIIRDAVFSENMGREMVYDGRYKYAHYIDGDSELYDMSIDPGEESNLALDSAYQQELSRLRALLLEHTLRSHRYRAIAAERPPEPARAKLDAKYRQQRYQS